ncbi:MAG TPA: LodA/GoxA family CTQ-dependent oxidase [Thermoanaerobaculia bacterium]|nr:LodA/GoxA family CTQ-dependent oxidase [Thermoanaerobaculia bacterium]
MSESVYRIHPAINFARVGNSEEYYIAPETMAGLPIPGVPPPATGGLPIKAGTESDTITSSDVRDAQGSFKRQAARFRIYQYPAESEEKYPNGQGTEVQIGSSVDGKTVQDIAWTVHVANKKANCYTLENAHLGKFDLTIAGYANGKLPPKRNASFGDLNDPARVKMFTIDPGPRTIRGASTAPVRFDRATAASYYDASNGVTTLGDYPKSFPSDSFTDLYVPHGPIETLGELQTDAKGRLLVLGGYGRAVALEPHNKVPDPLSDDVDNDGWFDDTSDGPVSATLLFSDGSTQAVHGAWVIATDPAYAPQTLNIVSLWDEIFDTWVRNFQLAPEIYNDNAFLASYAPSFDDHIHPVFRAAALQQWNTNLPVGAMRGHATADALTADATPAEIQSIFRRIRNPEGPVDNSATATQMPLALGDTGRAFLYPTLTQYFFLTQWSKLKAHAGAAPKLGPGEWLDKAALINCLGGRFSPGIDMTFIVRQPELYTANWQTSGAGPFRLNATPLDYSVAHTKRPLLTAGYVPLHTGDAGLEPGDASKFMAVPWHTDYNSCGTHPTDPNPNNSRKLYWSWPAQRPFAVYAAKDAVDGKPGIQRFSVRGVGTESPDPAKQGRYQQRLNMVLNWSHIGVVMQGNAIEGGSYDSTAYLEVASQLDDSGDTVTPWPNFAAQTTQAITQVNDDAKLVEHV